MISSQADYALGGSPPASGSGGDSPTDRLDYELARLPRDVTTAITWFMNDPARGPEIKRAELARRMGITPGRVSQILSGDENLTLRTLAAVCVALDAHFEIELVPNQPGNEQPREHPGPGTHTYTWPEPVRASSNPFAYSR